jgi:outer membrane protein OmpA-like peptidoglycan-associated protein
MKQIFFIALVIVIAPIAASAQFGGFVNRVNSKVKTKVNQRVDAKIDKAIDKKLDEIEGKGTVSVTANDNQPAPAATPLEDNSIKSFSKYDFIPGESILYYDNFEQEAIGELPTAWNTNGTGEVVTLDHFPGKWLRVHAPFIYLTSNQKEFSENYTVEFDIIMQLKNNGWMYPTFSCGLFSSNTEPNTGNDFLKNYNKYSSVIATIYPGEMKTSRAKVESFTEAKPYFTSGARPFEQLEKYYNQPVHIAIQVQKERFRMWINESKAFDVPKGVPLNYKINQLLFNVGQTNYKDDQYAMYISNIKVATGKADTRHQLIDEGKFSTTAILFDVNSSKIKPESSGVLNEISKAIKEHAGFKVKIIGHTDSDGSDAGNLALSQKRADAVKQALVKNHGIDESQITTDGKGESSPVADNKTKEGKAANRRVEFIKQ